MPYVPVAELKDYVGKELLQPIGAQGGTTVALAPDGDDLGQEF